MVQSAICIFVVLNPTSKRPTSGMLGVFLALQMCDHVDVSGFGVLFSRKAPLKVDYYQNMQLRHTPMTRQHSPKIETDLLRLMIREKVSKSEKKFNKPGTAQVGAISKAQ